MRVRVSSAVMIACVLVSCAAAQSPSPAPRRSRQPVQKDPPAPQSVAPVAPLSPEQLPASPPQVAFNSGILTIIANNSTLGDILRAVHRQTGATVDTPGNATERVVGRFGPGPVRDVLTLLLNGSHFNYVLLGSATNPNALDRVVLISRASGMEQPQPAAQYQVAVPQPAQNADASNDDAVDMTQEPPEPVDDQANQGQPEEQQPQQPNPFGQPGAVKTPEQLLQELQQRQQQMQQQQQQQGVQQVPPPTPTGVPQPPQPPPQPQ